MKQRQLQRPQEAGFTLVELSIVLVIIGLIVGGVLAGQDMIRAAEIRATISQIEEFNTAVNTFHDKYRAIPGDIGQAAALNFQLRDAANRATVGGANQNGLLECQDVAASCADIRSFGAENAMFWVDLATKNLIENSLTTAVADVSGITGGAVITPGGANDLFNFLPEAKLGKGNYITTFSASGRNFYQLTGISQVAADGSYTFVNALTPQDAFNIDTKMDDGKPLTGTVRALTSVAVTSPNNNVATFDTGIAGAAHNVGVCVELPNTAGAAAPYNAVTSPNDGIPDYNTLSDDESNSPACQLRLMFN